MFLMKLHPLRIIKVRVVSLFPSGLGIVSEKVKLCYIVKLMLKRRRDWGENIEGFELTFSMKQKFPIDWLHVNVSPTKNNFIIRSLKVCIKTCALVSKCMLPLFHTIKIAV